MKFGIRFKLALYTCLVVLVAGGTVLLLTKGNRFYPALITSLFILLGMIASYSISLRFITPLQKIERAMEEIREGRLGLLIPVQGKNELGYLARAIEATSQRLKETLVSRDRLLQEVEERKKNRSRLEKGAGGVDPTASLF